jgi:2-oxoglutarate ferredoxin oxidoreductase subunit beta
MKEAISVRGFSYVDIIQPCITWDHRPLEWFRSNVKAINPDHDQTDYKKALELSLSSTLPMLTGVFFRAEGRSIFGEDFYRETGFDRLAGMYRPSSGDVRNILEQFKRD